jgi:hypothetical protein
MITCAEEALLLDLLRRHDTPTEAVRKALDADQCELRLKYDRQTIVVRDINYHRGKAKWRQSHQRRLQG